MSKNLIKKNADKSFSVNVYGREYGYKDGIFPESIKIKGEEILYSPISVTAVFGDKKGQWQKCDTLFFENTEEKGVFAKAAEAENAILNADIRAEEDGFIRTDFRILSHWSYSKDNVPRITELYIDIPVKKKFASLMHFWPNCESGVCLSDRILNSHETPENELSFPFKPYMWLGWEYGGLGVCMESDEGIELLNKENSMVVTPHEEYINLRINLFDAMPKGWQGRKDEWGDTLKPKTFSIGLQATPVKKYNDKNTTNWRAFHLYDVQKHNIYEPIKGDGTTMLEKIAASGANWLILHEDWTVVQNYGKPRDEEDFKRFVSECHQLGLKLMLYFGYEISSLLPGFNEMADSMLNKNINGNFVGGWQREPMQRDFSVCYNGGYSEIMLERVKYVMDELGADGIYTDGTYVPWECANEAHGCGYRNDKGELCYKYPIYAVREHVKKLYKAVHERGGIIDTHQSSCLLAATLSYADSYFDGENIQGMVKEDLSFLKLDSFRCEFIGKNLGIPCNFISYTSPNMTIEKLAGITFLHNVFPRARIMNDLEFMSSLWKVCDEYDTHNAEFIPYWENSEITSDSKDINISLWKNGHSLLMCVFTAEEITGADICIGGKAKIKNVFTKEEYTSVNGKVTVNISRERLNLFELQR